MLLTMFYIESYLTDSIARLKVLKLPLTIRGSAVFPEGLLNEGGFLAGRLSMAFQTCNIRKLRGQYFDLLLIVFNIRSYLTDSIARAKVFHLPLTL